MRWKVDLLQLLKAFDEVDAVRVVGLDVQFPRSVVS